MPLHASLGLTVPKTVARLDPADAESSEPVDAGGQKPTARTGGKAAPPRASVTEGEVETVTVRKDPLGKLYWERRYKGQLFAFTDALQARLQGVPLPVVGVVPVQLIQALPYLLTIFLLAGFVGKSVAPKAIGVPYVKER